MDRLNRDEWHRTLKRAAPRRIVLGRLSAAAMGIVAALGLTEPTPASTNRTKDTEDQRELSQGTPTDMTPPPDQERRGLTGPTGPSGPSGATGSRGPTDH